MNVRDPFVVVDVSVDSDAGSIRHVADAASVGSDAGSSRFDG